MTRRRASGSHALSAVLAGVVRGVQRRHQALAHIQARWARLVGPELAAHSKPVSLRRGKLVVHVDQPGDAFALSYERAHVLARLRRSKRVTVEDVVIRAGDL